MQTTLVILYNISYSYTTCFIEVRSVSTSYIYNSILATIFYHMINKITRSLVNILK